MTIRRICRIILVVWVLIALALGYVALDRAAQRDERADEVRAAAETTVPPTVFVVTNLPPPLTEAATVTEPARRADFQEQITPPPTPPPFDPVAYVNGLEYRAGQPESAMEAYRVVATFYGWNDVEIYARAQFVQRIMAGESAFCWNARRWTFFETGKLCVDHKTGVHDDAGFGQITAVLRTPSSTLCRDFGQCSALDTVASPWNSMLAFVVVLTEHGKSPWCYLRNAHVRNGDCATWPG